MTSTKNTSFSLNIIYLLLTIFFFSLIIIERNILDILYLGLITFYYLRIKRHRSSR